MDVGDWLRSLGLGQYESAFRNNDIDTHVLADLTAEDLRDLGVGLVGHRRKILSAIGRLSASNAVPAPATAGPAGHTAERRHLTVMFCDLVGSTALSARLDPEDMREVVRAYQTCCAEVTARYQGFVAQYLGDGIVVYFGYPHAHEDEAERAVRAGLDVIVAVTRLPETTPIQVRIGIATKF